MPRSCAAAGSTCSAPSSSAWASSATGTTPTPPWTSAPRPASSASSRSSCSHGALYRGKKSVMWSVVEKTALAEAEVEYHDHTSTTIWVRFPVVTPIASRISAGASVGDLDDHALDHPGQPRRRLSAQAIDYAVIRGRRGRRRAAWRAAASGCCVAVERLSAEIAPTAGILASTPCRPSLKGADLAGTICRPSAGAALPTATASRCRCCAGDFVTTEQGTGLVHIAPAMARTTSSWARARARGAGHGRRGRHLHRSGAGLRGRPRLQGGRAGDRGAAEPGCAAGARHARPQLPAFLALQGAADLPRHRPMVHPDGWADQLRDKALAAIDATRWVPARGRNRIRSMIETPARLVRLAGSAPGACRSPSSCTRRPARCCATRPSASASRPPSRPRAPMPGGPAIRRTSSATTTDARRLREGRRHPGRLVRFRLDPRDRAGAAAGAAMAGLALSRGLGPASRLVPFEPAGELRHARPGTLRCRPDPRLRRRRRGPQDVEVAGQRASRRWT